MLMASLMVSPPVRHGPSRGSRGREVSGKSPASTRADGSSPQRIAPRRRRNPMTTHLAPAPPQAPARRSAPWTEIGLFLGAVAALTATTTTIALSEHADVREVDSASPIAQTALYGQALIPLIAAVLA